MTKQAIYYTISRRPHASGYEVVTVTSEKPGRMIYGRDRDGMATHRRPTDCRGRFPTPEAAAAGIAQVEAVTRDHAPKIHDAERGVRIARENLERALKSTFERLSRDLSPHEQTGKAPQ